jgi:hypothetical protein
MIPATHPTTVVSGNNVMVVGKVSTGTRWNDWIPIKINAATGAEDTHGIAGNIGGRRISQISTTGKIAWLDYVPCQLVADADSNAWNTSATGFIPVYGTFS